LVYLKSVFFILLSLIINTPLLAQLVPNFSGSWTLNESKSELGEGGQRMISQKLTITQDKMSFKLERSFTGQDGEERKMSETYTLDGKESVNPVFNSSKKSVAVWADDKKSLSVSSKMVFERDGEQMEIKIVEKYQLAEADKNLSIESLVTSSRGERKAKLVYDKK